MVLLVAADQHDVAAALGAGRVLHEVAGRLEQRVGGQDLVRAVELLWRRLASRHDLGRRRDPAVLGQAVGDALVEVGADPREDDGAEHHGHGDDAELQGPPPAVSQPPAPAADASTCPVRVRRVAASAEAQGPTGASGERSVGVEALMTVSSAGQDGPAL